MTDILKVNEIFTSIQGEGCMAGWPTTFIRLTGCPLRCSYCDTTYAFTEGEDKTIAEILDAVADSGFPMVELTGGEPLDQAGARPLIEALCDVGYQVSIETGGGVSIDDVDERARIILDVKTPDSGMHENQIWDNLELLRPEDEVKFVICSRTDFEWARDMLEETGMHEQLPVQFSPIELDTQPEFTKKELAEWIIEDRLQVRLNLQLHRWIWGPGVRGV
jgi:7-carboxy-7-deazaguanine synthase